MIHRNARVLLTAAVFLPLLAGLSLAGGSSAAAAPSTLHFFQRSTLYAIVSATGTPLPAEATPAAGDVLEDSDLDYVGNHSHHARNWTASDHVVCSLTNSTGGATCFGEFMVREGPVLINVGEHDRPVEFVTVCQNQVTPLWH